MNNNTTYKDSPLGKIPSDWEVKTLGEVCLLKGEYGINASAVEYSDELPTYIRITDIDDDGKYTAIKKASVDDENSQNFLLKKGDIVFARTGATVGKVAVSQFENILLNQRVGLIRSKEKVSKNYLKYLILLFLGSKATQERFVSASQTMQ
jgi:type I restriction enzyme S subunit